MGTPKPFYSVCGWECRYYPTIQSGPVFRWTHPRLGPSFEVSASREGVAVDHPVLNEKGLAAVAVVTGHARAAFQWLKAGIEPADVEASLIGLGDES